MLMFAEFFLKKKKNKKININLNKNAYEKKVYLFSNVTPNLNRRGKMERA